MESLTTVFLLDHSEEDVAKALPKFQTAIDWLNSLDGVNTKKCTTIEIVHIPGTVTAKQFPKHSFYDSAVLDDLRGRINSLEPDQNFAILMNPILALSEISAVRPECKHLLSRDITREWEDRCPIYYFVGLMNFQTRALSLVGSEKAGSHYIHKYSVVDFDDTTAAKECLYYLYYGKNSEYKSRDWQ